MQCVLTAFEILSGQGVLFTVLYCTTGLPLVWPLISRTSLYYGAGLISGAQEFTLFVVVVVICCHLQQVLP